MKMKVMMAGCTVLAVGLLGAAGYQASAYNNAKISEEEAVVFVEEKYDGTVTEFEHDYDDGRSEYELNVKQNDHNSVEVELNSETGKIIEEEHDDEDVNKQLEGTAKKSIISMNEAIAIAMNKQSGHIEEAELDEDDGRLLYEIEIETANGEVEIDIDAVSGKILKVERDDD